MSPVLVELDLSVLNTDGCFVLEDGQDTLYLFFSPFTTLTQVRAGCYLASLLLSALSAMPVRHDTQSTSLGLCELRIPILFHHSPHPPFFPPF